MEHIEIDWEPKWESNIRPSSSALEEWYKELMLALNRLNRSIDIDSVKVQHTIIDAGFTDVKEEVIQCCVNPWSTDRKAREVARWLNSSFTKWLEPMSMKPMVDGLGKAPEDVRGLCRKVQHEIRVLKYHAYFDL